MQYALILHVIIEDLSQLQTDQDTQVRQEFVVQIPFIAMPVQRFLGLLGLYLASRIFSAWIALRSSAVST